MFLTISGFAEENLWEMREARDILFAILRSFVSEVRVQKAIPIIMVVPSRDQISFKLTTRKVAKERKIIQKFLWMLI